jgi:probable DNA repair protein
MPSTAPSERSASILPSLFDTLRAGGLVVTANNRSAAWIRGEYDRAQQARGLAIWPTAEILPWSAWLRTLWQQSRVAEDRGHERLLLPWQARRLWAEAVAAQPGGALLHAENATDLALKAWDTVQGWNGPWASWGGDTARDEQHAFVTWAGSFTKRCADNGWIDAPRLPLLLVDAVRTGALAIAAPITLFGFAEFSPRQQQLLDALAERGTPVTALPLVDGQHAAGTAHAVACGDPIDELRRCAQWCRSLLAANPGERIGVVIPDLTQRRAQVERVFTEMLAPQSLLGAARSQPIFNLSQGEPLSAQALVATALGLLRWTRLPLDVVRLAALLRSSYMGHYAGERSGRAALLRAAIEAPYDHWPLPTFANFAARYATALSQSLRAFAAASSDWHRRRSAKEWRTAWQAALDAVGFLVDHPLDSVEFQLRRAWSEMLDAWMRAESIAGPLGADQALHSLQGLADTTIHQPEQRDAPVQVLGFLEAAGLEFDSLWVCGLTAERWPPAPVPNPLLPLPWQKAVGAPHANAERELQYFRQLTAQFAHAADAVVFSWPATVDDVPQTPSPLLAEFPQASAFDLLDARQPSLAQLLRGSGALQSIDDRQGLPVPDESPATASSGVIEAQAHCPFHAYARARLRADEWPESSAGLNPLERGILVHCLLAEFWNATPSRDALRSLTQATRSERIERAVAKALETVPAQRWEQLGTAIRRLEGERLAALLDEWLVFEAERPPFAVVGSEVKQRLALDRLELRLRVDRIDRIDAAEGCDPTIDRDSEDKASQRWIVIDYKTGKVNATSLQNAERLIAPQLPLYAEAVAPANVVGVAFGGVRRGECSASGVGAAPDDWDALRPAQPDWPTRRALWRDALLALARNHLAGDAMVDPWRYPLSCERCHRQALCRINERLAFVPTGEGETPDRERDPR